MMHRTQYRARTYLVAALVAIFPSTAPCEIVETINDSTTGISVMVPAGYSAILSKVGGNRAHLPTNLPAKIRTTIQLKSNDSTGTYCILSFESTTVPDKWASDKSKRTLHKRFRTTETVEESKQCIPRPDLHNCELPAWSVIDGKLIREKPVAPSIQVKLLRVQLRALFNYIAVTCTAKIEEYDKQRPTFEAVIKSVNIPY